MLKAVRVRKHPDHGHETWFRLFLDDELDCSFPVSDEAADEVERLLNDTNSRARIEALEAALRPFAEAADRFAGWETARRSLMIWDQDLHNARAALREPGAGVSTDGEEEE